MKLMEYIRRMLSRSENIKHPNHGLPKPKEITTKRFKVNPAKRTKKQKRRMVQHSRRKNRKG